MPEAPVKTEAQRIIDELHANTSTIFESGKWNQLARTVRERETKKFMDKYAKYGETTALRVLERDKATKSLIEKGVVFQNGQIEVQFY